MIVLYHHNAKTCNRAEKDGQFIPVSKESLSKTFFDLAARYPDEVLVWCEERLENSLDTLAIAAQLQHKRMMVSQSTLHPIFTDDLGYVDERCFLKVNPNVKYPTWIMNADLGGIYGETALRFRESVSMHSNLNLLLSAIAKMGQSMGLHCYQFPFLAPDIVNKNTPSNAYHTYFFVRQYYGLKLLLLLGLCKLVFEKKIPYHLFVVCFVKSRTAQPENLLKDIEPVARVVQKREMDVIIPTLGRPNYLKDVLLDFSKQTLLPSKVIIIEQHPDPDKASELDYLTREQWPFVIEHELIHTLGACNARNLGLQKVVAPWVFLADDDNRFEKDLIETIFNALDVYEGSALTTSYLQEGEVEKQDEVVQWPAFGAGNSVVATKALQNICFDTAYEFGYGEDADFGMQLRNNGVDVLYHPHIKILHLKAPSGGFRISQTQPWTEQEHTPKPSPTVQLFNLRHRTSNQQRRFKLLLFFNYYKLQSIKNPMKYVSMMKKRWKESQYWANHLNQTKR